MSAVSNQYSSTNSIIPAVNSRLSSMDNLVSAVSYKGPTMNKTESKNDKSDLQRGDSKTRIVRNKHLPAKEFLAKTIY